MPFILGISGDGRYIVSGQQIKEVLTKRLLLDALCARVAAPRPIFASVPTARREKPTAQGSRPARGAAPGLGRPNGLRQLALPTGVRREGLCGRASQRCAPRAIPVVHAPRCHSALPRSRGDRRGPAARGTPLSPSSPPRIAQRTSFPPSSLTRPVHTWRLAITLVGSSCSSRRTWHTSASMLASAARCRACRILPLTSASTSRLSSSGPASSYL